MKLIAGIGAAIGAAVMWLVGRLQEADRLRMELEAVTRERDAARGALDDVVRKGDAEVARLQEALSAVTAERDELRRKTLNSMSGADALESLRQKPGGIGVRGPGGIGVRGPSAIGAPKPDGFVVGSKP